MFRKLSIAYGSLKLRWKILLSYLLLMVLLVVSLGFAAMWQTSRAVDEKLLTAISGSLDQLGVHISYRMQIVINSSEIVAWNNDLLRILKYGAGEYPLAKQIDDIQVLKDILMTVSANRDVSTIRLYMPDTTLLSRERSTFFPLSDIKSREWLPLVINSGGRAVWLAPFGEQEDRTSPITCVRCIHDPTDVSGCLGVLAIDINSSVVTNVMQRSGLLREARGLALLDSSREIVATAGEFSKGQLEQLRFSELNELRPQRSYRVLRSILDFPDWQILAFVPIAEMRASKFRLILTFLGILGVVSVVATVFTLALSRRISDRITRLAGVISEPIKQKDLSEMGNYDDEISQLERFLRNLIDKNRELVREVYEEQVAEKEAKLMALQMQINPHFLYNTLDTINWMALERKEVEISEMVNLLARFYRLSIDRGADVVSIADEIEHVRVFLSICQKRYEGLLKTEFDISEEILEYKTVKLILQPLAENAVSHGISHTKLQSGIVTVAGRMKNDHIEIAVMDNGVGMNRDNYEKIRSDPQSGFAIKNVDERVKMFCGRNFGLTYDFGVSEGTRAVIKLDRIR